MKSAFITGANKGIGFETARQLAHKGYFVYLGSRDKSKGLGATNKLKSEGLNDVDCIVLDVTSIESIISAKQELEVKTEKSDVLINNAGIRGDIPQPATKVSIEQLRLVFETNFFGMVQVTQQFIDLLKKSDQPKIVNVTSDLSSLTNHSDPTWKFYPFKSAAYSPSKTALNAYTVMLAYELKDENFKINCINAGHTATDFNNYRGEKPVEQGASVIVKYATLDNNGKQGSFSAKRAKLPGKRKTAVDKGLTNFLLKMDLTFFGKVLKSSDFFQKQKGSNIWLIGGGQINTVFLNRGLIDELLIAIICEPTSRNPFLNW